MGLLMAGRATLCVPRRPRETALFGRVQAHALADRQGAIPFIPRHPTLEETEPIRPFSGGMCIAGGSEEVSS